VRSRGGHTRNFFCVRNRDSATKRKHFRNHNSATFKEPGNRNSAIPESQFFWSPQLESFTFAIFSVFLAVLLSLWDKFLVSRETGNSKNIVGLFLNPSWAEEKGLESSRNSRRLQKVAELRKSKFEGPQSQFRNFF
jgi:hypothetical protein